MKLGTRGNYYQSMQGSYKPVARLPSSYMPFAYRYPTNILQYPDWTAFTCAALMLSSQGTATYTCSIHPQQDSISATYAKQTGVKQ